MKKCLCLLLVFLLIAPVLAETVQDQALAFIQDTGVAADSVTRIGNDVLISLTNGGTATLHCPGDFDPLNLSWRFDGATDADVALYLDHTLGMLAALEVKMAADSRRTQSYAALVESGLEGMTALGAQGARVLMVQMIRQQNNALDGLRGRLLLRLLEKADSYENNKTPASRSGFIDAPPMAQRSHRRIHGRFLSGRSARQRGRYVCHIRFANKCSC